MLICVPNYRLTHPGLFDRGDHLFWKLRLDLGDKVGVGPLADHGMDAGGATQALRACGALRARGACSRCAEAAVHAAWRQHASSLEQHALRVNVTECMGLRVWLEHVA